MLTPLALLRISRMRKNGIVNPIWTWQAAQYAKLPLTLACALLDQESGRGHNEWGHDPTIFVGGYDAATGKHWGEVVTKAAFLVYRAERRRTGKMQGVGPCQLTWRGFQDEADKLGGCWLPLCNMKVGFGTLAPLVRRDGLRAGVAAYNGTGAAAQRYATLVLEKEKLWASRLGIKSIQA